MADGAIMGRRAKYGTVVPGSAAETVITGCEITLPSGVDGLYKVHGEMSLMNPGVSGIQAIEVNAQCYVNDGSAVVGASEMSGNVGGSGATGSISVTSSTVRLTVADANGRRVVGLLEVFGVEMAITPA